MEIVKIRAQIKQYKIKISKPRSQFLENNSKIDKLLARLTVKTEKRENTQSTKIRSESRDITNFMEIKRIIRECYKQLQAKQSDNNEMDKLLEIHSQKYINYKNNPRRNRKI